MIDGVRAAFAGIGMAFTNREVWRSYLLIALGIVALAVGLDALGLWGLRVITEPGPEAAWYFVAILRTLRVLGTVIVLLLAPLISVFLINVLVPVFNEVPFLAGLRAIDPTRAAELEANEGLRAIETIVLSLVRLAILLVFNLFAFALSFIPVIGVVVGPVVGVILSGRQLGWELLDPYFTRLGMKMPAQREVVKRHRWAIIGFGAPFAMLFAVPFLGPLCFAWAQAAAAKLVVDVIERPPTEDGAVIGGG